MRQRLLNSASTSALPGQMKVAEQNKVAHKENKEEGSNKQDGKNSGNGDAPAIASQPSAGKIPASKPDTQPASNERRGHPFLDLFGKFGEVILHGLDIANKLLAQLNDMLMATIGRASKSADQANRL
jgi:hypothetical protein